jgi:hypothetical protein
MVSEAPDGSPDKSLDVALEDGHKLFQLFRAVFAVARFFDAMVQVGVNELFGKRLNGAAGGDELGQDFRAIAILVEHALDSIQLAGDPAETQDIASALFQRMMMLRRHGPSLQDAKPMPTAKKKGLAEYGGWGHSPKPSGNEAGLNGL